MNQIRIIGDLRVLKKSGIRNELRQDGSFLKAGSAIEVGEPEQCFYDHRDLLALPFVDAENKVFYILMEDPFIVSDLEPKLH